MNFLMVVLVQLVISPLPCLDSILLGNFSIGLATDEHLLYVFGGKVEDSFSCDCQLDIVGQFLKGILELLRVWLEEKGFDKGSKNLGD